MSGMYQMFYVENRSWGMHLSCPISQDRIAYLTFPRILAPRPFQQLDIEASRQLMSQNI